MPIKALSEKPLTSEEKAKKNLENIKDLIIHDILDAFETNVRYFEFIESGEKLQDIPEDEDEKSKIYFAASQQIWKLCGTYIDLTSAEEKLWEKFLPGKATRNYFFQFQSCDRIGTFFTWPIDMFRETDAEGEIHIYGRLRYTLKDADAILEEIVQKRIVWLANNKDPYGYFKYYVRRKGKKYFPSPKIT